MYTSTTHIAPVFNSSKIVAGNGQACSYDIYRHPAPTMVPVIFAGGEQREHPAWGMFVHHFSRITTVVETSQPVFGRTERTSMDGDFDGCLEVLAGIMMAEGFDKGYIVTPSIGGYAVYRIDRHIHGRQEIMVNSAVLQEVCEPVRKGMFAAMEAIECNDIEQFIQMVLDGRLVEENRSLKL